MRGPFPFPRRISRFTLTLSLMPRTGPRHNPPASAVPVSPEIAPQMERSLPPISQTSATALRYRLPLVEQGLFR